MSFPPSPADCVDTGGVVYFADGTSASGQYGFEEKAQMFGWGKYKGQEKPVEVASVPYCVNGPRSGKEFSAMAGGWVPWFEWMDSNFSPTSKEGKKAFNKNKEAGK